MLLGIRVLIGEDIGYHVTYGQQFWQRGHIVDHDARLYTAPSPETPPALRPEPIGGAWYDEAGRYRFPNANWLTQVLFGGVYNLGGLRGLNMLLTACVWLLAAGLFVLLRRLGAPWALCPIAVLLILLVAYERFLLRPELVGYLILLAQASILAPIVMDPGGRRLTLRHVVAVTVLQLLYVNSHSFFIAPLGLTTALMVGVSAGWAWRAVRRRRRQTDALAANAHRLLLLIVLQVAVCFVNPWTWRLAILPVQTAIDLSRAGATAIGSTHPWALYREMRATFANVAEVKQVWQWVVAHGFRGEPTRAALTVALALAAAALVAAVRQGRWAAALWILAGATLSLSMHRGMAAGAMVMVPVGAALLARALATRRWAATFAARLAAATAVLAALLAVEVASSRCYPPRYEARFGYGLSQVSFPQSAAAWLNEHDVRGRIWIPLMASSNLAVLLDAETPMPTVTNTWAYPPAIMAEAMESFDSPQALMAVVRKYDVSVVVVRLEVGSPALPMLFAGDPWALVHLQGVYAVFIRTDGPDEALARQAQLTPDAWDTRAVVDRAMAAESWPVRSLAFTVTGLVHLGWHDEVIDLAREITHIDPKDPAAMFRLGELLTQRALRRHAAGDPRWREDAEEARRILQRRAARRADPPTRRLLEQLHQLPF